MKRLITAGVVTFVLGVIVLLPARVVYHAADLPGVRLMGIDGTLWQGSAAAGSIQGMYVENLAWRLRPGALFTGRLAYDVDLEPAGGFLSATVAVTPSGAVSVSDVDGAIAIASVRPVIPAAGIDGTVRLAIAEAVIADGAPSRLVGTVEITNLSAAGLSRTPIGDFRAEFSTSERGIIGSIDDTNGMLDVAATIELTPDRAYVLSGLVAPTPTAPSTVVEQLRFLGSPNERGQRPFRFEGRL